VTYVEMTGPAELIPAAAVPGLTVEPVGRGSPPVPAILARIGAVRLIATRVRAPRG
jgi:hypothetical protein